MRTRKIAKPSPESTMRKTSRNAHCCAYCWRLLCFLVQCCVVVVAAREGLHDHGEVEEEWKEFSTRNSCEGMLLGMMIVNVPDDNDEFARLNVFSYMPQCPFSLRCMMQYSFPDCLLNCLRGKVFLHLQ